MGEGKAEKSDKADKKMDKSTITPRKSVTDSPGNPRSIKRKVDEHPLDSRIAALAVPYTAGDPGTKHCHHCRQPFRPEQEFVQCTIGKGKSKTRCNNRFHARFDGDCFMKHSSDIPTERSKLSAAKLADHVSDSPYAWKCAKCFGLCMCAVCDPEKKAKADAARHERAEEGQDAERPKKKRKVSQNEPGQKLQVLISPTKAQIKSIKNKQQKLDGFLLSKKNKNGKVEQEENKDGKKSRKKKEKDEAKAAEAKTPVKKKPVRPSAVADPKFNELFLGDCISKRLQIRDFVLRFGKDPLRIVISHVKGFADLEKSWSHTALKNLITNALSLVQFEKNYADDTDAISEIIAKIKRAKADTNELWAAVQEVVDIINGVSQVEEDGEEEEEEEGEDSKSNYGHVDIETVAGKLALLQTVIFATSETLDIKTKMEENALQIHKLSRDSRAFVKEESKKIRELHGKDKAVQRELDGLLQRFEKYQKMKIWLKKRVLEGRTVRIGADMQGNTYWLLCPLDKDDPWSTCRIYVEKGKDVTLPIATNTLLKEADVNGNTGDPNTRGTKDRPLRDKKLIEKASEIVEAPVPSQTWFYVEGSQAIYELASWVEYKANVVFYENELKKGGAKSGAKSGGWDTPSAFMVRLDTPTTKVSDPAEYFDKDARDNIVKGLKDVGDMIYAFENMKESEDLFMNHNLPYQVTSIKPKADKAKQLPV